LRTVGASRPFTANLRAGRRARIDDRGSLHVPKRSPHRWTSQPVPGGVATVAYLPELLHLEPPQPFTEDVRFVLAPTRRWVEEQADALEGKFGAEAPDPAWAVLGRLLTCDPSTSGPRRGGRCRAPPGYITRARSLGRRSCPSFAYSRTGVAPGGVSPGLGVRCGNPGGGGVSFCPPPGEGWGAGPVDFSFRAVLDRPWSG